MTQILINLIVFIFLSIIFFHTFKQKQYWWDDKTGEILLIIFVFLFLATGWELLKLFF